MSLGGIAIAIGATVDAEIVMIEACHKKLEHAPPGRRPARASCWPRRRGGDAGDLLLAADHRGRVPAGLRADRPGRAAVQAARLHQDLRDARLGAALDHLRAGAARPAHPRQDPPRARAPGLARSSSRVYEPFVYVALRAPEVDARDRPVRACSRRSRWPAGSGSEFMPPLNEGDLLYMPTTFPNISIEEAKRQLADARTACCASFPEVETRVRQGRPRRDADRSGAALDGRDHRAAQAARAVAQRARSRAGTRGWAPELAASRRLRPLWPEEQRRDLGRADRRDERRDAAARAGPTPGPCRSRRASTC